MSTIPDVIEREITVHAPQEKVYAAITDPAQIIKWFPDGVEGGLEAGSQPIFDFGEYGKTQLYIEDAKPYEYFSYSWVPGGDGGNTFYGDVRTVPHTLVEFFISTVGEETKVTVKESGFSTMPAEVLEQKFKDNSEGWTYMMDRLAKLFA